jgi:hypothetical protein
MHTLSTLRLILVVSLVFNTAFAPLAKADGENVTPDQSNVTSSRFHEVLRMLRIGSMDSIQDPGTTSEDREAAQKTLRKGLAEKLAYSAAQHVVDAGQTIIMVGISAGVQAVALELKKEHLEGKPIDPKHLEELSIAAVKRLLADGGLYSAMASSGIFGALGQKPLKILQAVLENEGSKKIFANLLESGISSFLANAGWEAGSELWTQATHLIRDDKDYERAKNLAGVFAGAARGNENDKRILGILTNNIAQILLFNDDLRMMWLYNSWRLHVATGKFVVQVSSMVAAGAIGTALFPGAGTLAGMMFGAVGGAIPNLVPDEWKEDITEGFRTARSTSGKGRLNEDRAQIQAWLEEGQTATADDFQGILKMQATMRSKVMNTYFEADYKRRTVTQALELEVATAKQTLTLLKSGSKQIAAIYLSKPQDLEQSLKETIASDTAKMAQNKADIKKIELEMREFYSSEIADLAQLMNTASHLESDSIAKALKVELGNLGLVLKLLNDVVAEGVNLKDRDLSYWIQSSNFRGYREEFLVRVLRLAKL